MTDTEQERLRKVRKALGMTQAEFGRALGMKPNSISTIESGKNAVSNQVCRSVCESFGIREEWLRTGEGEMFASKTRDEELGELFGRVSLESGYKRDLLAAMARLSDDDLEKLAELVVKLAKNLDQVGP